jgi:tetratricopeptide (TPR) repeat protein
MREMIDESATSRAARPVLSGAGGNLRSQWAMIGTVLAFGWAMPDNVSATEVDDALAAAIDAADQGRCDEATRRLAGIDGLKDWARLLSGQCYVRAKLYSEALSDLDRIREGSNLSAAQVGDVELYRGVALYHLERFAEASAALGRAEGQTTEDAQLALYSGLIALRNGDNLGAARDLESAARLSPELTEPIASYYAGLAWQGISERTRARTSFERVIEIDGEGPWGKEAAKLLESTELFPYYVRMSAGMEYDDNVILRGAETQFVQPGSGLLLNQDGKKDWRGVWNIDAGMQLFNVDDWSGGVTGGYYGNAHTDLTDFDTQYPTVGGYVVRRFGPNTTAQVRYEFGFAWIDEDSFLRGHVGELGLAHTWPRAGTTIVVADVIANDLRYNPVNVTPETQPGGGCSSTDSGCGPIGLNERTERNQDGIGVGGAVQHTYLVPVPSGMDEIFEEVEIGGGYRFRYYDSEGDEWEHFAHVFSAGIGVELPFDFSIGILASYEFRDFLNPSTFPDREVVGVSYAPLSNSDRQEHAVTFQAEIEKDLNEYFSVSARWTYLDNESNRRVYDYNQHIVGGYLNFRFD